MQAHENGGTRHKGDSGANATTPSKLAVVLYIPLPLRRRVCFSARKTQLSKGGSVSNVFGDHVFGLGGGL